MTPKYFIWRLTDCEPWQVQRTRGLYSQDQRVIISLDLGMLSAWDSNDYEATVRECKRLNAERKR